MASLSGDPCLALAGTQLAPRAEPWAGLAVNNGQKERFVYEAIMCLLLPLCHTHSIWAVFLFFFLVRPSFKVSGSRDSKCVSWLCRERHWFLFIEKHF